VRKSPEYASRLTLDTASNDPVGSCPSFPNPACQLRCYTEPTNLGGAGGTTLAFHFSLGFSKEALIILVIGGPGLQLNLQKRLQPWLKDQYPAVSSVQCSRVRFEKYALEELETTMHLGEAAVPGGWQVCCKMMTNIFQSTQSFLPSVRLLCVTLLSCIDVRTKLLQSRINTATDEWTKYTAALSQHKSNLYHQIHLLKLARLRRDRQELAN
jgi:hypothetical protein